MSERPFHERSTLAYVAVTIVAGICVSLAGNFLWKELVPPEPSIRVSQPASPRETKSILRNDAASPKTGKPPSEKASNKPAKTTAYSANSLLLETLKADYDSLANRLSAAEASLRERAHDLGNQPIKPEIVSSVETCRSDLAAAREALAMGNADSAVSRLNRAKEQLKYLESL
jgi:hypothetical protein